MFAPQQSGNFFMEETIMKKLFYLLLCLALLNSSPLLAEDLGDPAKQATDNKETSSTKQVVDEEC